MVLGCFVWLISHFYVEVPFAPFLVVCVFLLLVPSTVSEFNNQSKCLIAKLLKKAIDIINFMEHFLGSVVDT